MNGGSKEYKTDLYLIEVIKELPSIFSYEAPMIIKAFMKTVKYFIANGIEFTINDFINYNLIDKKERDCYVRYRDEHYTIPQHKAMKFQITKKLKDYLNARGQFEDVRHREKLPGGLKRTKDLF